MIRKLTSGTLAATLIFSLNAEEIVVDAPPPMAPEAVKENASYYLGYSAGAEFSQGVVQYGLNAGDLDPDAFMKAFFKAMSAEKPDAEATDMQQAMAALGTMLEEREKQIGADNLAAGKAFLAENAAREGVTTTSSGLQYEVLAQGGEEVYEPSTEEGAPEKQFVVHYKGTTIDGEQFDASQEGSPATMTLRVIPGFREALTSMPVGAKWKLFIPSELAYGERRQSTKIGPNSTLIFELELIQMKDAPAAPQGFPFPIPGQ